MAITSTPPANEETIEVTDADLPVLFRSADQFSLRRQKHFLRLVRVRYAGLIVAAITGVASFPIGSARVLELAAAGTVLALLVSLVVELFARAYGPEKDWYDGRVLAESAKTLAWRYMVGASPFGVRDSSPDGGSSPDGHEAATRRDFLRQMASLLSDVPDIGAPPGAESSITETMARVRAAPLSVRRATYIQYRIGDQQDWYARKADWNRRYHTVWWVVVMLAEVVALILAALRFTGALSVDLVGIVVAAAAAATGWLGVRQHATLARAYSFAAQDLAIVRARLEESLDEPAWAAEAADAEESISREHTLWRASRSSRLARDM